MNVLMLSVVQWLTGKSLQHVMDLMIYLFMSDTVDRGI